MRCGIGYDEAMLAGVEAVCVRRQIAFADRLPAGALSRDEAERNLTLRPTSDGTNEATRDRHREGGAEARVVSLLPIGAIAWRTCPFTGRGTCVASLDG
jgi:hypothetical protein